LSRGAVELSRVVGGLSRGTRNLSRGTRLTRLAGAATASTRRPFLPIAAGLEVGGREGAVDQDGVAGLGLAEEVERSERLTLWTFGH
jgi:hypothetical protein